MRDPLKRPAVVEQREKARGHNTHQVAVCNERRQRENVVTATADLPVGKQLLDTLAQECETLPFDHQQSVFCVIESLRGQEGRQERMILTTDQFDFVRNQNMILYCAVAVDVVINNQIALKLAELRLGVMNGDVTQVQLWMACFDSVINGRHHQCADRWCGPDRSCR